MDENELHDRLESLHSASFAWTLVCCGSRETAEDVLQQVYLKLLSGRASWNGNASFQTWLFSVIRNAAHDNHRRSWWSRVVRLEPASLVELPDATSSGSLADEQNRIRNAMNALPKRQHQVAHLVFYEGMTVADAATVMKVTVGAARQHYARAKASLRRLLTPDHSEL